MLADERLRAGKVDEALALLQEEVRKAPNNIKYRIFLFQLLALTGKWDRALMQLKVAGDLDAENQPMVQTYRELLRCEVLRAQVFAGQKSPLVFGEPQDWIALLVEAVKLQGQGKPAEAQTLREKAFDAAPTTSGTIDGTAFEWIADGDSRIGPMLEVIVNGRYSWLPFERVRAIRVEAPADLRDLVWMPVTLTLATGGETVAFIPTRYPGSEAHAEGAVQMARETQWTEVPGGYVGIGQRVWMTDAGEHPMLDVRELVLSTEAAADLGASEAPAEG